MIESRLAQLSPAAQELAGAAAVIGREFTFDVLAEANARDAGRVVRGLDELWQRRIVREQSADAYDFTHDKIRDVAYARLSPVRRRLLHRQVAQALETVRASGLDSVSGQLAAHCMGYDHPGLGAGGARQA